MEYNLVVPSYLSSTISDFQINMKVIRNDFHKTKCDEFKSLLDLEVYTDVRFICNGGETVTAHSSVLASVSPMLKEWMNSYHFNPDKHFSVHLPDVSVDCCRSFVQLLYGSTLVLNDMDQYKLLESLCQQLNIESSKILSQSGLFSPAQSSVNGRKSLRKDKVSPSPLPLCCWRCGATFSQLGELKLHVSEKHFGEKIKATKRHRCTKCKKVLPSMWKLRQHLLSHTLNNANVDHQYAEPRKRTQSRRSIDHPYANPPPPSASSDHPYSSRSDTGQCGSSNSKRKNILQSIRSSKKTSLKRASKVDSLHSYASVESVVPHHKYEEAAIVVVEDVVPSSSSASSPPSGTQVDGSSSSSSLPFNCQICHKGFPQKYRLARHVEEVHDQIKKYKCPHETCDKAFFKKTSLTRHALTHQNIAQYRCENCSKKFKDPSGLKYHVAKGVCLKKI